MAEEHVDRFRAERFEVLLRDLFRQPPVGEAVVEELLPAVRDVDAVRAAEGGNDGAVSGGGAPVAGEEPYPRFEPADTGRVGIEAVDRVAERCRCWSC
ncbi:MULTISPECIES: hypothetical protein [unclassified Curtobacterium]|uniref:hypothetical protein n=1 Tax=unclassified Curtobacterium TaxID=257496 RepID=UPI0011B8495A|nr:MULTISPECIES: hypothetical protein [unclassified Curtobacterium]